MSYEIFIQIGGWLGAISVLAAYALVSTKRVEGDSTFFQALNISGSILLMINSYYFQAFPSVAVNFVWVGIAIYSLMQRRANQTK
jgi:hypothetical protein